MPSELLSTSEDRVMVLALSSVDGRNLLTPAVCAAGVEALNTAADNPEVGAVVITGAGSHFSKGEDLDMLHASAQRHAHSESSSNDTEWTSWIEAIATFPKPILAAVEGAAIGAGVALALSCDFIVASSSATFSMPHGSSGQLPAAGAIWYAVHGLPRQIAAEMLLDGSPLSAARLEAAGSVNRIVSPGAARLEAIGWASRLECMPMPVVADLKELMLAARQLPLDAHLMRERGRRLHHLYSSDPRKASVDAVEASHSPVSFPPPWTPHS